MFKLLDPIARPSGRFKLDVFRNGSLIERMDEPNLVVANASQINALLVGGSVANNNITTIGFGTNGTAPASGNTSLTGAYTKIVDNITWPGSGQVVFTFSLASGEANGTAILEFGLFTVAGTLYARKVRSSALNKASDISLAGSWTLQF